MAKVPRNPDHENVLARAVKGKNKIELTYQKDLVGRTFEPYVVYEDPGTKNINVAGYQRYNPNKPGDPAEWRIFFVGSIRNLVVLAGAFSPDPIFSSFDSKLYGFNVLCAVDR